MSLFRPLNLGQFKEAWREGSSLWVKRGQTLLLVIKQRSEIIVVISSMKRFISGKKSCEWKVIRSNGGLDIDLRLGSYGVPFHVSHWCGLLQTLKRLNIIASRLLMFKIVTVRLLYFVLWPGLASIVILNTESLRLTLHVRSCRLRFSV